MNKIHFYFNVTVLLLVIIFLGFAGSLTAQYNVNSVSSKQIIVSTDGNIGEPQGVDFQVLDIKAHQLNTLNSVPPVMFSPEGLLLFFYASTFPYYLTIGAERPGVGFTFVTQNLFVATALSNLVAIRFSLQQLGITPGVQWPSSAFLRIYFHYSKQPLPNPGPDYFQYDLEVTPIDDDASNEYGDPTGDEPMIDEADPAPNLNSPIASMTHYGCTVPNVDLDNSSNSAGTGYAGDKNACGPAAASNSMMWLSKTFEGIPIPFSHRALLDSLSKYMGRMPNSGVNIETFVQGKLNFIKAHNLPIRVKFQSQTASGDINASGGTYAKNNNTGAYPTWDFLKQEMADSEDVELFYKWFDGDKWRGHVVAVTGVYETEDGKKTIGIKHDINQSDTGGTVQEYPSITVDNRGRMILHRHGAKRYVAHIVSESPGSPFITSLQSEESATPNEYALKQSYPNPFNPTTTIKFQQPRGGNVKLKVFDALGIEIVTLVDEYKPAGSYEIEFNASNLPSGIYFYQLSAGNFIEVRKMVLLK